MLRRALSTEQTQNPPTLPQAMHNAWKARRAQSLAEIAAEMALLEAEAAPLRAAAAARAAGAAGGGDGGGRGEEQEEQQASGGGSDSEEEKGWETSEIGASSDDDRL